MKPAAQGYRVAIVGASSLLGKELLRVLEERAFPVSRLITYRADEEESDLPIVDLRASFESTVADEDVNEAELDFAFLAARPRTLLSFLRPTAGNSPIASAHCFVVDLGEGLAELPGGVLSVPSLDPGAFTNGASGDSRHFVSAHPAAIVISSLLLRLAAHFPLKSTVAHIFGPASEIGPRAIEELQKQTVNLLSFQKIPRAVFGAQLAFNLLPRFGRARRGGPRFHRGGLTDLEKRIRTQVRHYLAKRVPLPALRLFQAPVFYSLAFSLYVEMVEPAACEAVAKALVGERIRLRQLSEEAPSQVEAAGSGDILVDAITPDAEHPAGIWIWAAVDNLRLAAENAVEIAERLRELKPIHHPGPAGRHPAPRGTRA